MTFTANVTLILADAALKTTLLLGLTAIIAARAHRASAAARHLIWALGLVGALSLPLLTLTLPNMDFALPDVGQAQAPFSPPAVASGSGKGIAARPDAPDAAQTAVPPASAGVLRQPAWAIGVIVVWLSGVSLILIRLISALAAVRRIARASVPLAGPLADSAAAACRTLALRRPINFRQASAPHAVSVPMGWGCLPPTVVLPAGADGWPPEQAYSALLHELAHVKRQDWLVQMLTHVACALYWFHPFVWIAARQARQESEYAGDDLVLGAGIGQGDYANHLLNVARAARALPATPIAAFAMVRPSALNRRLSAILAPRSHRKGRSRRMVVVTGILTAACVCALATLRPIAASGQDSSALRGALVVVDAGHGGQDTGYAAPGGVTEKALNLAIAQRLRAALEQRGATVFMARDGDTFPSLLQRARFANAQHADYLISVHCDAVASPSYGPVNSGVFYHGKDLKGRRLAESVADGLRQATDKPSGVVSDTTRFLSGFAVLREASMPSVLVECGNMTHLGDLARLRDPKEQQRIAEGIAIGLSAFQKIRRTDSRQD